MKLMLPENKHFFANRTMCFDFIVSIMQHLLKLLFKLFKKLLFILFDQFKI